MSFSFSNRGLFSIVLFMFFIIGAASTVAQTGIIRGQVIENETPSEFARVTIHPIAKNLLTDNKGEFAFHELPYGTYELTISGVGYKTIQKTVILSKNDTTPFVTVMLTEPVMELDDVVITGTKTYKRKTNSPIIVNVLSSEGLEQVQACNLSDGLKFQAGLRVETDCQTCNYTQLRMNGLAGGYSQILINGRPVFSPLTGLYGMEQMPANMIERIEVIRGGGSSLYGSSAIGGTVNVITKIPRKNNYQVNYTYQNINAQTNDQILSGNGTWVTKSKNAGTSIFFNRRIRDFYDHNADGFSELPFLRNTSFGINSYVMPKDNHKLEFSLSNLNEYRFGGEMITDRPVHLRQQGEERNHHVWMGTADYQINFNNDLSSLIAYVAAQHTSRDHYTGILPGDSLSLPMHLENPPYGISTVNTLNVGMQLNHEFPTFLKTGDNVMTLGMEYLLDDVYDEIESYNYLIDQNTRDLGLFVQSDWNIVPKLFLLSGVRMDQHNFLDQLVWSPRASLLYKAGKNVQLRLNYGAGFRAPQAFDTDLHIAFAGGGVSRISLSPDLRPERSHSLSSSINYDKPLEHFIAGFTIEGFYTRLNDAFYLQPVGQDEYGYLFEKQNGQGATVHGATVEMRANYDRKMQLEAGFTIQQSYFDSAVIYIEGVAGITEFIRTPNEYGFINLSFTPNTSFSANINYVYTGRMMVPHFAGASNQNVDEIVETPSFSELNIKGSYTFRFNKLPFTLECYAGVKNILNAYQESFDIGKNRDSNFVFGPAQPRTIFVGIKLSAK